VILKFLASTRSAGKSRSRRRTWIFLTRTHGQISSVDRCRPRVPRQCACVIAKRGGSRHESARGCKRRACRTPRRLLTDASRRNSAENLRGISESDAKRCTSDCTIGATKPFLDGVRDGRLQTRIDNSFPKDWFALHDVRFEELLRQRVCVAVAPQRPFCPPPAPFRLPRFAAEPLVGPHPRRLSELL